MNRTHHIGNLARDVELAYTPSGMAYARMTIAVAREKSKDKTDFINVIAWDKTAENCAKFLVKGSKVAVSGSLQSSSYEKDGVKKYSVDIVANRVEFLNTKSRGESIVVQEDLESTDASSENIPF